MTTQNGFARALMFNYQNYREFPKMTCRAKAIMSSLSYSGINSILKIEYKVLNGHYTTQKITYASDLHGCKDQKIIAMSDKTIKQLDET